MTQALADRARAVDQMIDGPQGEQKARALRDAAGALLESLHRAKAECEDNLAKLKRSDAMKAVTGASAIDRAIQHTRETLDELNRALGDRRPKPAADGRGLNGAAPAR